MACELGARRLKKLKTINEVIGCTECNRFEPILTDGHEFKDQVGRNVYVRGLNVVAKHPVHSGGKNSFVGSHMPEEEADEHFARIKYCGYTVIRLLVTWEAVEGEAPGVYDESYLIYLHNLVRKAERYGISVIIDFHQDAFSRHTGGSGAPCWTFEKLGLNPKNFEETGAAVFHQSDDKMGHIRWYSNNFKMAAGTMNTCFFGGNLFAQNKFIDGVPVQEYLQGHFEGVVTKVMETVKGCKNILGVDVWNEPEMGYIGVNDLSQYHGFFKMGETMSAFESFVVADGNSTRVPYFDIRFFKLRNTGYVPINLDKKRAWMENTSCIWRNEKVWDYDKDGHPALIEPNYFARVNGKPVDVYKDAYHPFINRMTKAVRAVSPDTRIYIQHLIGATEPNISCDGFENIIHSCHWYDGITHALKRAFRFVAVDNETLEVKIGMPGFIRKILAKQIKKMKGIAFKQCAKTPFMVTEMGIPHDLRNKRFYRKKSCSALIRMVQRSFSAVEDNCVSFIAWCYNFRNTHSHGDSFNGEDFSIWSKDSYEDASDIYAGIKVKKAILRPYVYSVPGMLLGTYFCPNKRELRATYRTNSKIRAPVEVFLPNFHFQDGFQVELSDGKYEMDYDKQMLTIFPEDDVSVHSLRIRAKKCC